MAEPIVLPMPIVVGRRQKLPQPPIFRESDIRENGRYRYSLIRIWGNAPPLLWVISHPEASEVGTDDATVRRIMGYSYRWGYGGVILVSLYPCCAGSWEDAKAWRARTRDGENEHFGHAAIQAGVLARKFNAKVRVAAWGQLDATAREDLDAWLALFKERAPRWCIGVSGTGDPLHPSARGASRVSGEEGLRAFRYPLPTAAKGSKPAKRPSTLTIRIMETDRHGPRADIF